ncbi:erythronate-4-phosphate dehydrogenase [Porphyromonas crevioricanis JCM 15906]|uniref:Erythronate-4-phosphate dehydrogenase n=1 Tax=Porphyromonas crevioricanis JCM 15906 TaxID=1305617 RepID=S4PG07_9PORP|nr:4-phosphoerythronate dehydrogenase [Porphyromonas crevioricanis]GAD04404.1 erythronate-4-phosphate dehydrogenase [Porphyromonas crevioricanis JCM 15906]SJZ68754.1 4-phosphoerythronate dehydrogenase [Porphyromonas crevioricanis]
MGLQIVAEASVPYLRGVAEKLGDVHYLPNEDFSPENIAGADALIVRSVTRCTEELLRGSAVKLICTATAGYDHIDVDYCRRANIAWRTATGCNASAVAQYVISVLSSLILKGHLSELSGRTIGIIGVGHVGKEVDRLCSALGMRVLRNDPPRAEQEGAQGFASIEQIWAESHIITLHTPLTKQTTHPTHHLVNTPFLDHLEQNPLLINAARGGICDTPALIRAIHNGQISGLVCDCWEGEPQIDRELVQLCNIATPHIAGFSADGKSNGARLCLEAIADFFGVSFPAKESMQPPAPQNSVIDLDLWSQSVPQSELVYRAILHTLDTERTDCALRKMPEQFEQMRKSYIYPREPQAYHIRGGEAGIREILRKIGFQLS